MWSDLIDDKGRKRAGIFYKAAFYDRSARIYLTPRYSIRQNYDLITAVQYIIFDCEEPIYETEEFKCEQYSEEYFKATDRIEGEALTYLKEQYPDWKNPVAYWEQS